MWEVNGEAQPAGKWWPASVKAWEEGMAVPLHQQPPHSPFPSSWADMALLRLGGHWPEQRWGDSDPFPFPGTKRAFPEGEPRWGVPEVRISWGERWRVLEERGSWDEEWEGFVRRWALAGPGEAAGGGEGALCRFAARDRPPPASPAPSEPRHTRGVTFPGAPERPQPGGESRSRHGRPPPLGERTGETPGAVSRLGVLCGERVCVGVLLGICCCCLFVCLILKNSGIFSAEDWTCLPASGSGPRTSGGGRGRPAGWCPSLTVETLNMKWRNNTRSAPSRESFWPGLVEWSHHTQRSRCPEAGPSAAGHRQRSVAAVGAGAAPRLCVCVWLRGLGGSPWGQSGRLLPLSPRSGGVGVDAGPAAGVPARTPRRGAGARQLRAASPAVPQCRALPPGPGRGRCCRALRRPWPRRQRASPAGGGEGAPAPSAPGADPGDPPRHAEPAVPAASRGEWAASGAPPAGPRGRGTPLPRPLPPAARPRGRAGGEGSGASVEPPYRRQRPGPAGSGRPLAPPPLSSARHQGEGSGRPPSPPWRPPESSEPPPRRSPSVPGRPDWVTRSPGAPFSPRRRSRGWGRSCCLPRDAPGTGAGQGEVVPGQLRLPARAGEGGSLFVSRALFLWPDLRSLPGQKMLLAHRDV